MRNEIIKNNKRHTVKYDDNGNVEKIIINDIKKKEIVTGKKNSIIDNLEVEIEINPMDEEQEQYFRKYFLDLIMKQ